MLPWRTLYQSGYGRATDRARASSRVPMLPLVFAAQPSGNPIVVVDERPDSADAEAPRRIRNGFVLGLTLGGGLGRGAGYPNNSDDVGHTGYQSTAWDGGTGGTVLVMGALADYLNFGFWVGQDTFRGNGQRATQTGVGLRVEAFPFVFWAPQGLAGLGLFTEYGLGTGKLTKPGEPDAGGTQSFIGVGALYEWSLGHFLGGHFGLGPSLEYDAVFTTPYDQNGFVAGLRAVWYGGP